MTEFTLVHVAISLVGIGSGLVVLAGLLSAKRLDGWTGVFLASTAATSATGFFFPYHGFKPSYAVGALSLIVLTIACLARYRHRLAGPWRRTYVVSAVTALYFNVFVLVAQSFLKIPALRELAPTQSEPPFQAAQAAVLALFVWLGVAAVKNFRGEEAA
jgi:hypothetical protein